MPLLVVQRGHVPRRRGSTGAPGEQAMATAVAAVVARLAPAVGWDVAVIDADPPSRRAYRGDVFFAVHGDGSENPRAHGASVGWQTPDGRRLGAAWKTSYRACGWPGGFRADNYTSALAGYYGVRRAVEQGVSRAVIVEVGFMSNPADRRWIDAHPDRIGESIVLAATGRRPTPPDPDPDGEPEDDMMRKGARGPDVAWLQRRLNGAVDLSPPLALDGVYGDATAAAVARFARSQGWADHDGATVTSALLTQIAAYAHGVAQHGGRRV